MSSQDLFDSQLSWSSSVKDSQGVDESWTESPAQSQDTKKENKVSQNYIVNLTQLLLLFK